MSTVQPIPGPAFADSLTCRNLRSAYLGEMHARRHYLHAAQCMEEANLHVIAHAFRFTAAQEKEHADVLCGLMTAHGGCVPQAEEPPLALPRDPVDLLRSAALNKHGLWDVLYPQYADAALEEGYPRIALALRRIAETEQLHARRFVQYLEALSDGSLFASTEPVSWLCLPCGQLHTGLTAPESCPSCGRSQGHFIRSSHYPFSVEG